MKSSLLALLALTLPLTANPVAGEGSDLKPDSQALFGEMDNGFKYIIYPNSEPPNQFSVRLHIAAGSLMEDDNQRGLAHFLEHMVFNGSRNFTAAELIPKMQRLGIAFGAHANAYTSFDETVYMLDLPNQDPDTVDLTFTVMRDFADGALLLDKEIDTERGVIIAEKTSRDSVEYRLMLEQFDYLIPNSRLMQRVPIGTEEVIKNAPRERFVDFYTRFYTPERMTFIIVGDFDPKEIEKRVRENFISLRNPDQPGKNPPRDTPPTGLGFRTEVFTDKELSGDNLSLNSLRSYQPQTDTAALRASLIPLSVAHNILNRRFETLAKQENSPILSGGAGRNIYFNMIEAGGLEVTPVEGKWKEAVATLEQELRKAIEFGFSQEELDEASARFLNQAEEAVKRKDTRRSPGIAMSFVNAVAQKSVFTTPETTLEITQKALAKLTPDDLQKAFNDFWKTEDLSLIFTTREAPENTVAELQALFLASREVPLEAPTQETLAPFAYTDFGTPGTVTETKTIDELGITQITLSNNIRLNLKPTDFQKNTIALVAQFGSGQLTQPQDAPALNLFAQSIFEAGGLGKHSTDDLQRLLAGKNVDVTFGIDEATFTLNGRTTPADLALQLQLMAAFLTDPGFRPEGERLFRSSVPMIYQSLKHSMQGAMVEMAAHLHGGDSRYTFPTQEELLAYQTQQVKDWLLPDFQNSPLELSLVGDFSPETALPLILQTFGALPARQTEQPTYEERRKISSPKAPENLTLNFESKIPNAAAVVAWQTQGVENDIKTSRRLNLLASILSDRLREEIREKLGASYSPRAGSSQSQDLQVGYLQAMAEIKPEETQTYGDVIIKIADDLAQNGITEDELERALAPVRSNLKESLRDNGYWLNTVLSGSQQKPQKIDWARTRDQDYETVTVTDLNALAKKYLPKSNALLYQMVPTS